MGSSFHPSQPFLFCFGMVIDIDYQLASPYGYPMFFWTLDLTYPTLSIILYLLVLIAFNLCLLWELQGGLFYNIHVSFIRFLCILKFSHFDIFQAKADEIAKLMNENEQLKIVNENLKVRMVL